MEPHQPIGGILDQQRRMPRLPPHPQQPARRVPDPTDGAGLAAVIIRAEPDRLPDRQRAERIGGVAVGGQGRRQHDDGPQGQVWRPVSDAVGAQQLQGGGHRLQHGQVRRRVGGGAAEEAAGGTRGQDGEGRADANRRRGGKRESKPALVKRELEQLLDYKRKELRDLEEGGGKAKVGGNLRGVADDLQTVKEQVDGLEAHLSSRMQVLEQLRREIEDEKAGR